MHKRRSAGRLGRLCAVVAGFLLLLDPMQVGFAAPDEGATDAGTLWRDTQTGERVLPEQPKPDIEVRDAVRPPMTADMSIKVTVDQPVFTGQNIFPPGELEELIKNQLHKEMTLGEFNEKAVTTITKHFQKHGYFLAQAYLPEQVIENGRVEIAVLVGRFGEITLQNTSRVSDQVIKKQMSGLRPGNYIKIGDLDRASLLLGDLAGVAAKITLSPGKYQGIANVLVEVKAEEDGGQNSLALKNWGDRYTGIYQTTLNYVLNNPVHSGDSLTTTVLTSGSRLLVGAASYCLPLSEGMNLNVGYSKVNYRLGAENAWRKAHGSVSSEHADLTWKVKRSRDANLSLQVGYNRNRMRDFDDAAGTASEKSTSSISLGIVGDSFDSLWRGGASRYSLIGYRGSIDTRSNTSAPTADHWEKVKYTLLRHQKIQEKLALLVAFSGQWASTNLDTSEKFPLGGPNGVRAYTGGDAPGDEGWLLNNELHWTLRENDKTGILKIIMFYDVGVSTISKNPAGTGGNRKRLAGTGLGISWDVPNNFLGRVYYAWKACDTAASDSGNGRLWVQATKYF